MPSQAGTLARPSRPADRLRAPLLAALDAVYSRHAMGRSAAEDRSVLAELDLLRRGERILPAGTTIEWLGTAGFRLRAEGTTILIDPFITRRDVAGTLGAPSFHADGALVDRIVPTADAVLVGHCHFDHAVDVPHLARRGATVYGSTSVQRLLGLHGLAGSAVVVDPEAVYEIGPFTVRFVPSVHSKLLFGLAIPSDGELSCDSLDALDSNAYRCGQVFGIHITAAGTTLYHQGSADLDETQYHHGPVDVLLPCIAGRAYTRRFIERTLRTFRPTTVVPHHLDDFFRPVDAPMGLSFNVNAAGFIDDLHAADPDVTIRTLTPLVPHRGPG